MHYHSLFTCLKPRLAEQIVSYYSTLLAQVKEIYDYTRTDIKGHTFEVCPKIFY